jgi:hypothetical protein
VRAHAPLPVRVPAPSDGTRLPIATHSHTGTQLRAGRGGRERGSGAGDGSTTAQLRRMEPPSGSRLDHAACMHATIIGYVPNPRKDRLHRIIDGCMHYSHVARSNPSHVRTSETTSDGNTSQLSLSQGRTIAVPLEEGNIDAGRTRTHRMISSHRSSANEAGMPGHRCTHTSQWSSEEKDESAA